MSNWNLGTFDNIYATLAESNYTRRPKNITLEGLENRLQTILNSGHSVEFNFSRDVKYTQKRDGKEYKEVIEGGQNLPNDGADKKKLIYLS
ncbi:hypothetical protein DIX60_08885 [Streptococcus iniae]|uniref:hypothetical protein n=1 Tax=Streptococcus iniae TaxID=1346 RepID=UPI0008DA220E|nr:hypothetical protein [Streptococcus iniae]OHX28307.1 hypothetical protein BKX95_00170 [Streptococcus iniae]RLV27085.1 hypothetical protein DIX60_08885 [Streptococcus iniae]